MDEKNKFNSNKNKKNNKYFFLLELKYKFFLILHFLMVLPLSNENSEIIIWHQGTGYIYFIYENFYRDPSEIKVNGAIRDSCKKQCDFEGNSNKVEIKFEEQLISTENMFNSMDNITEVS